MTSLSLHPEPPAIETSDTRKPLTFWRVAFAVCMGNLLAAFVGGIVWVLITH